MYDVYRLSLQPMLSLMPGRWEIYFPLLIRPLPDIVLESFILSIFSPLSSLDKWGNWKADMFRVPTPRFLRSGRRSYIAPATSETKQESWEPSPIRDARDPWALPCTRQRRKPFPMSRLRGNLTLGRQPGREERGRDRVLWHDSKSFPFFRFWGYFSLYFLYEEWFQTPLQTSQIKDLNDSWSWGRRTMWLPKVVISLTF